MIEGRNFCFRYRLQLPVKPNHICHMRGREPMLRGFATFRISAKIVLSS